MLSEQGGVTRGECGSPKQSKEGGGQESNAQGSWPADEEEALVIKRRGVEDEAADKKRARWIWERGGWGVCSIMRLGVGDDVIYRSTKSDEGEVCNEARLKKKKKNTERNWDLLRCFIEPKYPKEK